MNNKITFNIEDIVNSGNLISDELFEFLSIEEKRNYTIALANSGEYISDEQFKLFSQKEQRDYAVAVANDGDYLQKELTNLLSNDAKKDYFIAVLINGTVSTFEIDHKILSKDLQEFFQEYNNIKKLYFLFKNNKESLEKFQKMIKDKYKLNNKLHSITDEQFKLFSQDEKIEYSIAMLMQGEEISASKFYLLSPNNKKEYLSNKKNKL